MKLVVLGARGMLGSDVSLAAENAGHELRAYGHIDVDVTSIDQIRKRLELDRPDAVINCAAWTDVDGAEDEPGKAMEVNATGAGNVATVATELGARVVYVSTDYVFDGTKGEDYVEGDIPAPISVYGSTKLEGERATAQANRRSFIVRSSWLFGLNGPNFVDTMLRLGTDHGEVLVVHDQVGSPTWTWHLAYGIVRLIDTDGFGLYHMAAAGRCSWYEFAKEIFEKSGMEVVTLSATTEMLGRKAPRPPFSALDSEIENTIELPPWEEGLAGYLAQRQSMQEAGSR